MIRLNLGLLLLLVLSSLYLVHVSYQTRHLFTELERAHALERQLKADATVLEAERLAAATRLRVEEDARNKLGMRQAAPDAFRQVLDSRGGRP